MFLTALRSPFLDAFLRGGFELAGGFSPVTLFAAGQQGAVYDPSDFAALYQDSAGATPVTAVEQPLGLMLDKRLGLALGTEQVVNGNGGTFDTNIIGVAAIGAATISRDTTVFSSGGLKVVSAGANTGASIQVFSTVIGKAYKISASLYSPSTNTVVNGASLTCNGAGGGPTDGVQVSAANTIQNLSFLFVATATSTTLFGWVLNRGVAWATTGDVAYYDNVSIKLLDGNHATQATAASRPILRQDASLKYFGFNDGIDDSMSTTTGGGGTAGYFLCQGIKPTGGAGTIRTIWSDEQANAGYRVRLNAANQLELSSGSGTPLAPPVQAAATTSTTGGTGLAASTAYFYVITALNAKGESLKSNEVSVTTGLGTTNSNSLSWAAAAGATDYRVYRGLATGAQDVFYVTGNVLAFTDTGAAATAGTPPTVSETAYTAVATAAATTIGTTSLLTVWDDGTNLNAQLGSGAVASVARTVVAAGTAGFTAGKRNGAAAGFFTGNLYADVYRQIAPNATERLQVQRYVANQSGVTL